MQTADWLAIALAGVTVLSGFLAFVETLYPPETHKAKGLWFSAFGALVVTAIVLVIIQQKVVARDRATADAQMHALSSEVSKAKTAAEQAVSSTTGGDSFVFFRFLAAEKTDLTNIWIIHHGDYPLHDIQAIISDLDHCRSLIATKPFGPTNSIPIFWRVLRIPQLSPHTSTNVALDYPLACGMAHNFLIQFSGPNGMWFEQLRVRQVNGVWLSAVHVIKQDPKHPPIVFDDIEAGYPELHIDWLKHGSDCKLTSSLCD